MGSSETAVMWVRGEWEFQNDRAAARKDKTVEKCSQITADNSQRVCCYWAAPAGRN
jgi:hypothetical protein